MWRSAAAGRIPPAKSSASAEIRVAAQFVNRRAAHHAVHTHLRADGRHEQRVAILKVFQVTANAVQQQVVNVHLLDELPAARVAQRRSDPRVVTPPAANRALSGVESELMS